MFLCSASSLIQFNVRQYVREGIKLAIVNWTCLRQSLKLARNWREQCSPIAVIAAKSLNYSWRESTLIEPILYSLKLRYGTTWIYCWICFKRTTISTVLTRGGELRFMLQPCQATRNVYKFWSTPELTSTSNVEIEARARRRFISALNSVTSRMLTRCSTLKHRSPSVTWTSWLRWILRAETVMKTA